MAQFFFVDDIRTKMHYTQISVQLDADIEQRINKLHQTKQQYDKRIILNQLLSEAIYQYERHPEQTLNIQRIEKNQITTARTIQLNEQVRIRFFNFVQSYKGKYTKRAIFNQLLSDRLEYYGA